MGQGGSNHAAQLEERYFLQKVKLGQGSFGTVWRAVDRQKNRTVAIKQLDKAKLPRCGVTRLDIEREIKLMQACSHENITELYDTFEDNDNIYLALEYCAGGDFGDKVKERGMAPLETEVAEWMRQMCSAIHAMHRKGICHRDIKPDNFMIHEHGALKLSDFGLAVYVPEGGKKLLTEKCGTPAFMSPEQHRLPKWSVGYSFPADMWAVGVAMYMMMFGGKHPFLTEKGALDDNSLLSGELDFRDKSGGRLGALFAGFVASLRFSDAARSVCKRLVEPDPNKRLSAEETGNLQWFRSAQETVAVEPCRRGDETAAVPDATPALPPAVPTSKARSSTPQRSGPMKVPLDGPLPAGRSATPRRTPPRGRSDSHGAPATAAAERLPGHVNVHPAAAGPSSRDRARTPGPEGRKAMEEAARLEVANQALLTELEERKKREEELLYKQKSMEWRQKLFEKQKTRELEDLEKKKFEQEKELMAIQEQKRELEKLRARQGPAPEFPPRFKPETTSSAPYSHSSPSRRPPDRTAPEKVFFDDSGGPGVGRLIAKGTKCRYQSGTYGWMEAVVMGHNDSDHTYNLDCKIHVKADKISPTFDIKGSECWPAGTCVSYFSPTADRWLPTVVTCYNESNGTYDLSDKNCSVSVREHAHIDRIRSRWPDEDSSTDSENRRPNGPNRPILHPQVTQLDGHCTSSSSVSRGRSRPTDAHARDCGPDDVDKKSYNLDAGVEASPATPRESTPNVPPRWLNKGDHCHVRGEQGLCIVESAAGRSGCYTIKVNERKKLSVSADELRAPKDAKVAWPAGTQVSYMSTSANKWIDAQVISFIQASLTYNLDVRYEADPEKVRPR